LVSKKFGPQKTVELVDQTGKRIQASQFYPSNLANVPSPSQYIHDSRTSPNDEEVWSFVSSPIATSSQNQPFRVYVVGNNMHAYSSDISTLLVMRGVFIAKHGILNAHLDNRWVYSIFNYNQLLLLARHDFENGAISVNIRELLTGPGWVDYALVIDLSAVGIVGHPIPFEGAKFVLSANWVSPWLSDSPWTCLSLLDNTPAGGYCSVSYKAMAQGGTYLIPNSP